MANIRIHRYTIDPAHTSEFLTRRAALISAIRARYPGLVEARLIKLQDGTLIDSWRWDSAEHMRSALNAARTVPEVRAAMSLTSYETNEDGEVIDER